jgi:hypothetical protein
MVEDGCRRCDPRAIGAGAIATSRHQNTRLTRLADVASEEQFAPESADQAFGEAFMFGVRTAAGKDLGAEGFEQARESSTQLGVAIDHKHFGLVIKSCNNIRSEGRRFRL